MKYYSLVQRDEFGLWWPQFGDYDRDAVVFEREDWIASGVDAPSCLKVIITPDESDETIRDACARLSGLAS